MAVVIMMIINDDNGDDDDDGDGGYDGDGGDDYSRVAWLQLDATMETQHCLSSVTVSV